MAIASEPTPTTKICHTCRLLLPLDNFRRTKRGSKAYDNRCRRCHADYMRERSRRLASKSIHQFTMELKRARSVNRVIILCARMFERFDGVEGFAKRWMEVIEAAMREKPGSKTLLDSFLAIARLLVACGQLGGGPDLAEMSEAQIEKEIRGLVRGVVAR